MANLTPLSPTLLVWEGTAEDGSVFHPDTLVLADLLDGFSASVVDFSTPTMVWDAAYVRTDNRLGAYTGTLDGTCVPLSAEGEEWAVIWTVTVGEAHYTDRQPLTVGFGGIAMLCTRQQVKDRININGTEEDARIDALIASVLGTVTVRYGVEFMPRVTETRTFNVWHQLVGMDGCDLVSATEVVVDPNGTPVTLVEGTDYFLLPCRLTGTSVAVQLMHFSSSRQIAVTGTWGVWAETSDVPADIQEAAMECVLSWLDRPVSDIAAIDSPNPRALMPGVAQTWDIPSSAHRKFSAYNRNLGVY